MEFTLLDIILILVVGWIGRGFIKYMTSDASEPALMYVRERISGMEFELEQINGIWYCWILEDKVYTFVGQNVDRVTLEEACKKRVHEMCLKGLTSS